MTDTIRFTLDQVALRQQDLPAEALPTAVVDALSRSGGGIRSIVEDKGDLEDAFLQLTEKLLR